MFPWNATFILVTMMVAMSRLPERQWLSSTVISFILGFGAMAAQPAMVAAFASAQDGPRGEALPWYEIGYLVFFSLMSAMCAKDVVGDWLLARDGRKASRKAARKAGKASR